MARKRHRVGGGRKRKMPLKVLEHFAHKTLERLKRLGGTPRKHFG